MPRTSAATGFTDLGDDIRSADKLRVALDGYLRLRGELLYNFDLDRGLTPSGRPLFPVPLADPSSQLLTYADMRLRTDLAFYAPGVGAAVKIRADLLDNLALGSTPEGAPAATTSQSSPPAVLRLKRAYGEVLTPFGLLVGGRTGSHFGLGMVVNGGDCADCDHGDVADRIAFICPVLGHIFALAYDFSATMALAPRPASDRAVDVEPTADVHTFTFAALRWRSDSSRTRRRRAGKATVEYGLWVSYRFQPNDIPATYYPTAPAVPPSLRPTDVVPRGYQATGIDGWFRLTLPWLRLEAEAAVLFARIEQVSLLPGVLLRDGVSSTQFGAALESDLGRPEGRVSGGLDLGFASGDPAPGFGAFPSPGGSPPQPGELDGPQAFPPRDTRIDNFRFHPDYRVDRILFREIIGTVTDAFYLRPHISVRLLRAGSGTLLASLAAVVSMAVQPTSTPGGQRPLGVELDPTLIYETRHGFSAALEHAVLFPLAGLDNPAAHLDARPAQLLRLRLMYGF